MIVFLITVGLPKVPPTTPLRPLLVMVHEIRCVGPTAETPPPKPELLPLTVLFCIVRVPEAAIPPPFPFPAPGVLDTPAVLLEIVLPIISRLAPLYIPPPLLVLLKWSSPLRL